MNVCNSFFKLLRSSEKEYLDVLFKKNERETLGRRLLIIIYLLEDYKVLDIVAKLSCGRAIVMSVKKDLDRFEGIKRSY